MNTDKANFERDRDFSNAESPQHNPPSVLDRENQHVLDLGNDVHWDAIKSPKRLKVLEGIRQIGPCTIPELTSHLEESTKALYYHISKLNAAGLVQEEGMIRTSAPRKSFIYRATLPDCIIPIQYDPDSEKEMKRMRKSRKAWGEFMLASFDKNCTACTGASGRNRRISKMNWIHVTEDQKENIESLFEALRDAIERAEMYEPKQGEERTPMQYSLWMVPDKINTGPLPAIRPFRKRSGRVTK